MNELLKGVFFLSLSGSALILAVLLICRLLGGKLRKRWQYYIWLLVALRLLIPFSPPGALLGRLPVSGQGAADQAPFLFEDIENEMNQNLMTARQAQAAGMGGNALRPDRIYSALGILWAMVAAGLLLRKITTYQAFAKYIGAGRIQVEDIDQLNLFGEICDDLGLGGPVELCTNSLVASPLLIGILRPCVVLPTVSMPIGNLRYIYLHELTHLRRRDILYKWALQVVLCLHWFNPLVHYMVRQAGRLCELSCDEAVVAALDGDERKGYGATLLDSLRTAKTYREPIAALTLCENAVLLQERLTAIGSHSAPAKRIVVLSLALTLCLLGSGLWLGAYPAPHPGGGHAAMDTAPNPLQKKSALAADRALMLIETGGANVGVWYLIGYTLPYMSNNGVDAVVERFNAEYTGTPKTASAYYDLEIPSQDETEIRAYEIMRRSGNFLLFEPLLPYLAPQAAERLILEHNHRTGDALDPAGFFR